jgi:hypothetical protein
MDPNNQQIGPFWVLTNLRGEYVRAVQMAPRTDGKGVQYIVTVCECYETKAKFCKRAAARMLAALLNAHEHRAHKKWKAERL